MECYVAFKNYAVEEYSNTWKNIHDIFIKWKSRFQNSMWNYNFDLWWKYSNQWRTQVLETERFESPFCPVQNIGPWVSPWTFVLSFLICKTWIITMPSSEGIQVKPLFFLQYSIPGRWPFNLYLDASSEWGCHHLPIMSITAITLTANYTLNGWNLSSNLCSQNWDLWSHNHYQ